MMTLYHQNQICSHRKGIMLKSDNSDPQVDDKDGAKEEEGEGGVFKDEKNLEDGNLEETSRIPPTVSKDGLLTGE